ncbi:MAG: response regulator transcription factor [Thermodesulfobacteriota bacterium]|nr:response regulator transcription factor [Thermodesulfobacteriota bacterium]
MDDKKTHAIKKILIVDDHPIFRHGLSQLINQVQDMEVCGEAEDLHGGIRAVEKLGPDMAIIDITLKKTSGIELIKEIHLRHKRLPMLVISMHEESLYAERSLRAGAKGYIMKQETPENIITAIRHILDGGFYASPEITDAFFARVIDGTTGILNSPVQTLTDRELEIFQMIGHGIKIGIIADRLHLSVKTIGTHRENIKEKLHIKDASELMRYAINWLEHNPEA